MKIRFACLAVSLLGALTVCAGTVAFTAKPTVSKEGDTVKISFSVSAPTDVEVAVLDATNRVIRHLAAGVLGATNAPPAPLKAGLVQQLIWDGKDDFGALWPDFSVQGGATPLNAEHRTLQPFSIRVRAGMSVKFGRIIGTSPYTGMVGGLAVDPDGRLYMTLGSFVPLYHVGLPWQLRQFDKAGNYQKTLLPYAASTPPDKTPGFRLIDAGDGQLTPGHNSPLDVVLFQFGDNIHNKVVDGQLVFIDNDSAKLTFFKVDGSNAIKVVPMRTAADKLKWPRWLAPQVAFSPDGKYAYYSNVANTPSDGKRPADIDPKFPQGRIYRQDLRMAGSDPETFYDLELPDFEKTPYWMPSAWDKKTAAAGIAVDAKGNLLICDLVNQEVVEVSPEGKKLNSVKVPWPDRVAVSSRDGTLYVISTPVSRGSKPPSTLLKVSGFGADAKAVATLTLKGNLGAVITLDESGAVPALWVGGGDEVVRVEDHGSELALVGKSLINPSKDDISFVCYGDVDADVDLVYVTSGMGPVWRFNGETGEGGVLPFRACDVAIGPNGMIYGWGDTGSFEGPIARYGRDAKPAPLAATGKNTYGRVYGRFGRGNNAPGMAVDWQGRVYVECGFNDCHVRAYDAAGKLVEFEHKAKFSDDRKGPGGPAIITYVLDQGGSLRADPAGNLYVLELGLPKKGFMAAKGFEKDPAYTRCSGTIYKFTQKGGEFTRNKAGDWEAEGAIASYSAPCGPLSGSWNSGMSVCHCTRPRFGMDAYGRLYVPNGITFKVTVRDNSDNEIANFGGYGNWDAQGPKSGEPKPAIPLGWPMFAGSSDKYIYVGDGLNHRVVRVDKVWAAEAVGESR